LDGIRGQITPCEVPLTQIGEIRKELLDHFEKFEQEKVRQKEIEVEIGRKRSIQEKGKDKMKKRGDIKSYFTPFSPLEAHCPQANRSHMQPTLDDHWKKELRETACDYIARWWYDSNIPFNASCSPYYELMLDAIFAAKKGFKGPTMHELRGFLLQKEVSSIDEYLKDFKSSRAKTRCIMMSDGWTDQRNCAIINFLIFCPQGTMFLKSVDASDRVKDAHLFQLLDEVVE